MGVQVNISGVLAAPGGGGAGLSRSSGGPAGADDYLDKSVDASRFVARVRAVMRRSLL